MSHIFISYSHDEGNIANRLANDLLDMGYGVWIDNLNLRGGTDWEREIEAAIDGCDHFLLLWSANIEASSYSQKEVDRALKQNKKIIPLFWSGDPSRMWSQIKALQYVDMRDYRSGFSKLTPLIPLPSHILPPPDIKSLIKQGDMTFNSAARLYRSHLSYGERETDVVGLLVERSEHGIQTFLAGQRKQGTPHINR